MRRLYPRGMRASSVVMSSVKALAPPLSLSSPTASNGRTAIDGTAIMSSPTGRPSQLRTSPPAPEQNRDDHDRGGQRSPSYARLGAAQLARLRRL